MTRTEQWGQADLSLSNGSWGGVEDGGTDVPRRLLPVGTSLFSLDSG